MPRSAIAIWCAPARRWRHTRLSDGRTGGWADGASWHLIVESSGGSGSYNMQVDEGLLARAEATGERLLRLYRWDPPTLSVGRNQPLEGIETDGIRLVRRPTGGQAVWHEHEVTYAVAAPIAAFGSLRAAYCAIHSRLAAALWSLGVQAELAPARAPAPPPILPSARPPVRPSARPHSCFAAAVGGEILVQGRKLVGSAQVRRRTAFLQHGSILLAGSQGITLAEILKRQVSFEEVVAAIVSIWPSAGPSVRPAEVASLAP